MTPLLLQVLLPQIANRVGYNQEMFKTMCIPMGLFGFTWLCIWSSPVLRNHNLVRCVFTIAVWYVFDYYSLRPMVIWIEQETGDRFIRMMVQRI